MAMGSSPLKPLTPRFPFRMVPLGGRGVQGASTQATCCLFPQGVMSEAGQPGSGDPASRDNLTHHWVIRLPTPMAHFPQVREEHCGRMAATLEDEASSGPCSVSEGIFLSGPTLAQYPLSTYSFFWETHLHLSTLAHCYFHHQECKSLL